MKKGIIVLSTGLILVACQKNTEPVISDQDDLTIRLLEVEDTRCPEDAMCAWEGNATVMMRGEHNGNVEDFTLNIYGSDEYPNKIDLWEFEITLNDLTPYPKTANDEVKLKDYDVSLTVQK